MAEEEGSRFPYSFWGSKNIVGLAKKEDVENISDFDGIPFVKAMENLDLVSEMNQKDRVRI